MDDEEIRTTIFGHTIKVGVWIGFVFLTAVMFVTVANVIARLFGSTIPGTYELITVFMLAVVGFALAYTAWEEGHIIVDVIVSKLPSRIETFVNYFNWIIVLCTLVLITKEQIAITIERALAGEKTEILHILWAPFRILWVLGLILFCLVALRDLLKKSREEK
jgi:TRAP-type C4-dicarboxylate transport system permease small subunit